MAVKVVVACCMFRLIGNLFVNILTEATLVLVPCCYSNIKILKSRKAFQGLLRHALN
jgi:hypothetical protein